jgi:hypothetical protein
MGLFYKSWIPVVSGALSFKSVSLASSYCWRKSFIALDTPFLMEAATGTEPEKFNLVAASGTFDLSDSPLDNIRAFPILPERVRDRAPGAYTKFMFGWSNLNKNGFSQSVSGLVLYFPPKERNLQEAVDNFMGRLIGGDVESLRSVIEDLIKNEQVFEQDNFEFPRCSRFEENSVDRDDRRLFSKLLTEYLPGAKVYFFKLRRDGEILLHDISQSSKSSEDPKNRTPIYEALQAYTFLKRLWHADKHHEQADDKIQDVHFVGTELKNLDTVNWRLKLLHGLYREVIRLNKGGSQAHLSRASGVLSYAQAFRDICVKALTGTPSLDDFNHESSFNWESSRRSWDALIAFDRIGEFAKKEGKKSVRDYVTFACIVLFGVFAILSIFMPFLELAFSREFEEILIAERRVALSGQTSLEVESNSFELRSEPKQPIGLNPINAEHLENIRGGVRREFTDILNANWVILVLTIVKHPFGVFLILSFFVLLFCFPTIFGIAKNSLESAQTIIRYLIVIAKRYSLSYSKKTNFAALLFLGTIVAYVLASFADASRSIIYAIEAGLHIALVVMTLFLT